MDGIRRYILIQGCYSDALYQERFVLSEIGAYLDAFNLTHIDKLAWIGVARFGIHGDRFSSTYFELLKIFQHYFVFSFCEFRT